MPPKNRTRRRRRQDKPAITAHLVLDDRIKVDTGVLSEDLIADLFPYLPDAASGLPPAQQILHVAITPWVPDASPSSNPWAIVPITRSSPNPAVSLTHSTIRFSPSSIALQTFAVHLQRVAPAKLSGHSRNGIEILILDVMPLPLTTVFVSLDNDLSKRLEIGEGTFYSHRPVESARAEVAAATEPGDRLAAAVRIALGCLTVVHAGDMFPLPLAPHPITHVPPNPGRIALCEPVAQGILTDSTRIIVMTDRKAGKKERRTASLSSRQTFDDVKEDKEDDEDDDASTDHFYSAAEDRGRADVPADNSEAPTESESEESGMDQDEDLSDDSMDDMISLQAPTLPTTDASGATTVQPGTPVTLMRGRKTNGLNTPGSVFSVFTANTARPERSRGRFFKAHGLLGPMSTDLLHPRPAPPDDDDEARVYVDMTSLPKIGCFSGDWVRIEGSEGPPTNGFGPQGFGSLGLDHPEPSNWRPARVFGLPQTFSSRPVSRIPSSRHNGDRRSSFFESQLRRPSSSPPVYMSPLLLANLDSPSHLRIAPLSRSGYQPKGSLRKLTSALHPPFARDITIHPIQSQISVDRVFQTAVFGGLKRYFAHKVRLVCAGDLIAVPVDSQLGRIMQESPGAVPGSEVDDVMWLTLSERGQASRRDSVAWFKVGHTQVAKGDGDVDGQADDLWGSVVCFDSSSARMHVAGPEKSRVLGTKDSSWQQYLGLRRSHRANPSSTLAGYDQGYVSPIRRQIRELVAAATSPRAVGLDMPPVAMLLTSTHRNIGKTTTAVEACADVGLHAYCIDAHDVLSESEGGNMDLKAKGLLTARSERAVACGADCCVLVIQHLDAFSGERVAATLDEILEQVRVLIVTANEVDKLSDAVRGIFTHELEIGAPDEAEREAILRSILSSRSVSLDPAVELNSVALKTASLVAGGLADVVDRALIARSARVEKITADSDASQSAVLPVTVRDVQVANGPAALYLTKADLDQAVDAARKNFADAIGAPKIPNVSWDDVGGLGDVKAVITETIQLPLERPELFARGLRKRSGILFYGPPGTGKTLLAKAIATEYSLNFFSVKGPELLNMYVGESEANVRRVFARARDARPCVVFFDELDSVAPKRGNQGDSGGVMDRIVSQLLAELDGMSGGDAGGGSGAVFVVGATNRPDLLDPALLRPGRFDKMLYLGVPDTRAKQVKILEALTRKFDLQPSISLPTIADRLPLNYTGADFYALCSDAMLKAVTRQAAAVETKIRALNASRRPAQLPLVSTAAFFDHHAGPDDMAVAVSEADFAAAQRELVPSVSTAELTHYERVRALFEGAKGTATSTSMSTSAAGGGERLVVPVAATLGSTAGSGSKDKQRAVSDSSRGEGRAKGKGKGKGKAVAASDGGESEEGSQETDEAETEATRRAKRKGKAVASTFRDSTASDDDELY